MISKIAQGTTSSFTQKINDYKLLVKFRLNMTVVFSAVMAFLIASTEEINWIAVLVLALAGFLVTGAANALNQVLARDADAETLRRFVAAHYDFSITKRFYDAAGTEQAQRPVVLAKVSA